MKKSLLILTLILFGVISMNAQDLSGRFKLDSLASNGTRIVEFVPEGVCSVLIHIEVNKKNIVEKVEFTRGCNGNGKGIGALIKGMKVEEAITRLKGIPCGKRATSCPDQLATALIAMQEKSNK